MMLKKTTKMNVWKKFQEHIQKLKQVTLGINTAYKMIYQGFFLVWLLGFVILSVIMIWVLQTLSQMEATLMKL